MTDLYSLSIDIQAAAAIAKENLETKKDEGSWLSSPITPIALAALTGAAAYYTIVPIAATLLVTGTVAISAFAVFKIFAELFLNLKSDYSDKPTLTFIIESVAITALFLVGANVVTGMALPLLFTAVYIYSGLLALSTLYDFIYCAKGTFEDWEEVCDAILQGDATRAAKIIDEIMEYYGYPFSSKAPDSTLQLTNLIAEEGTSLNDSDRSKFIAGIFLLKAVKGNMSDAEKREIQGKISYWYKVAGFQQNYLNLDKQEKFSVAPVTNKGALLLHHLINKLNKDNNCSDQVLEYVRKIAPHIQFSTVSGKVYRLFKRMCDAETTNDLVRISRKFEKDDLKDLLKRVHA